MPVTDVAGTPAALEAIELSAALEAVAQLAAGPLGAARVRARRPSADLDAARTDLSACHELAEWLRAGGRFAPAPVEDMARVFERLALAGSVLDGPELAAISRTLAALRITDAELARALEHAPQAAALRVTLPARTLDRQLAKTVDPDGYVRDDASASLGKVRRRLREQRDSIIARLEALLRGVDPGDAGGGVTLRGGRYVLPVRRELRARVRGIVHDESASGGTLFIEPSETVELGNALRELEGQEAREVQRILRQVSESLRPELPALRGGWEAAIAADDLAARARYAVRERGQLPLLEPSGSGLCIAGGRHPLLVERERAGGPGVVPFDLELDDSERTILLSGPNTGGKTVLMKGIGLIAALAQSGVIPPVDSGSRLPLFRTFFADIGDRQSIAESLSTFSAHVAVLRGVLEGADDASLVLLDEVGAGTDPIEGGALAGAALRVLTGRGALTLATTHLGTLKELAGDDPRIVNASLQFDSATLAPTYRLVKGVPGRSYGLAIARRLGMPVDVLGAAEAAIPRGERDLDRALADLERQRTEVDRRSESLERREAAASRQQAEVEARAQRVAEREESVRVAEREAVRQARATARRYLLDARREVEDALVRAREAATEPAAREARRRLERAVQVAAPASDGAATETEPVADEAASEGDRVRTPMGAVGTVRELRPDGRVVVEAGGIRLVLDAAGLERIGGPEPPPGHRGSRETPLDEHAPSTIDLRGLRADEAEAVLMRAIDDGVRAALPELTVIHGKGTGALRECVQRLVTNDPRVAAHRFASPAGGGAGVTLIRFAP